MGTRCAVEGNAVRLFMQWGSDYDSMIMDLSCNITYQDKDEYCAYYNLVVARCKNASGDIHYTGENRYGWYIELDVAALKKRCFVATFSCNAYSNGAISPIW